MPACWKAHITRPEQSNCVRARPTPRVGRADPGQRGLDAPACPRRRCASGSMARLGRCDVAGRDAAGRGGHDRAGHPGGGGTARRRRGGGGMAASASRWPGVSAWYCDLTTAICTCSWLCLDCRSARTAAACSAAVFASAADLAEASCALAACVADRSVAVHLRRHLGGHHPLNGELVDEALRRVGGQHRVHAAGPATHVLGRGKLIDRRPGKLPAATWPCRPPPGRRRASPRRPAGCQLVVQVELRRVHRLGGPLGLPRQLVELCQRIVGGVSLHIAGKNPAEQANPDIAHMMGRLTPRVVRSR